MTPREPTYQQMYAALLALLNARKESTEEFRRASYRPVVQSVLDAIEEREEKE